MARYKLTRPHFLGQFRREAGEVVDWNGPPTRFMIGVDAEGKLAAAGAPRPPKSLNWISDPWWSKPR